MLRKLLPPTGVAAAFEDDSLDVGSVSLGNRRMICVFNWGDTVRTGWVRLPWPAQVTDFWSGAALGRHSGTYEIGDLPGRSARLLDCRRS